MITITLVLTLMTSSGQSITQVKMVGPETEVHALYERCEQEGRSWSRDLLKNGKVIIANYNCI